MGEKNCARNNADNWRLEQHVCSACFGRIVSKAFEDERIYKCSNCDITLTGDSPSVICACGIKIGRARILGKFTSSPSNAGIRCHENSNRTPEMPSLIVASFTGGKTKPDC